MNNLLYIVMKGYVLIGVYDNEELASKVRLACNGITIPMEPNKIPANTLERAVALNLL